MEDLNYRAASARPEQPGQVKINCSELWLSLQLSPRVLLWLIVDAPVTLGATLFAFFGKSARSDISSMEIYTELECTWRPEANVTWRGISQIHSEVSFNSRVLLHAMEMEKTNIAHFWSDIILWHFISMTAAGLVLPQHLDGFKTSHRGTGSSSCSLLMWLGSVIMHPASPALCIHVYYAPSWRINSTLWSRYL